MTGEDDTGNPARLPLMDRAKLGLPIEEPELILQQIAELEFPEDSPPTARGWWREQIEQAIERGDLAAHEVRTVTRTLGGVRMERTYLDGVLVPDSQKIASVPSSTPNDRHEFKTWRISRDAYRTWHVTLANLPAPAVSCIRLWLGPAPALWVPALPQGEPDRPEQGAADSQNPAMMRQCVADKARFLKIAAWKGNQQATVNHHPEAAYFKGEYDMPTLLKWASEIDPRPKGKRGGRPRKA